MPKFECEVHEQIRACVYMVVEADTKEEAAKIACDSWVSGGREAEGYAGLREDVDERWVEIDGESVQLEHNS